MMKTLEAIQKYILYIVLGLFGIFVLLGNSSPFVVPKEALLLTGCSLILLIWVLKMFVNGSVAFHPGKFDLGVLFIALAYLIATFLGTPNKMEAYLLPGTTTFVLGGAFLYFLINQFDQKIKAGGKTVLLISGVILAVASLLSSLNVFSKIPQLPAFVKEPSFNLMGGAIPSIMVLVTILVFSVGLLIKEKDSAKKVAIGFGLGVMLFALTVLVVSVLPGKATSPRFLTTRDSWEVTVDTLKKSPLLGVGPANYLTAFNLFKPLSYNQTDLWQIRFTTASNHYFTLVTETGLLGLFALSVLLISVYRYVCRDLKISGDPEKMNQTLEKLSLVILLVLFGVLPVTPTVFVYLFILLGLMSESHLKTFRVNIAANDASQVSSRIPVIIVSLPFLAGIVALAFFGIKVLKAESTFSKSLVSLSKNDAKNTYDQMNDAIRQNPKVDRYHASFAQVNMALASSIAGKKDITEEDRTTITQLVQQAISEGKATVSLNPLRSGNWEVLAQIYRSIMPFAQGADQFTVQTYSQAIALDPTNPNLRIALGGVYYSLGNFDSAIDSFKLAVLAKPDLANSHYNLAIAYREKKDYDSAITAMNNVISLVSKDSQDYSVAKQTLDDLQSKKKAVTEPASSENLTPPQPVEETNIDPPIELPEEASPPATTQE
jgi:tetratricopeptide (TPR) repeat protein